VQQFQIFREALIGKSVSHVWRGHGSAIFLEVGELSPPSKRRDGSLGEPTGELSVCIEWSWRIERIRSILGGSWSSERTWPGFFKRLHNAVVLDFQTFGRLPEMELSLSNGLRLVSFMTAEGQPQWYVINNTLPITSLLVTNGKLCCE
jgi:hypothetical protein